MLVIKEGWDFDPEAYVQDEFLDNEHEREKIAFNGTFLSRLLCCGVSEIDDAKMCLKCRQRISVCMYAKFEEHASKVAWHIVQVCGTARHPIGVLVCPLCNTAITEIDRICRDGPLCGGGLCDVEVIKSDDVWAVHRRIRQIRYGDTDLDPCVRILESESFENVSVRSQPPLRAESPIADFMQKRRKSAQPLRNTPHEADFRFVDKKLSVQVEHLLPRHEVYEKYVVWMQHHFPDLPPLINKSLFKVIRARHPDVVEAPKRVDGILKRCFLGIYVSD